MEYTQSEFNKLFDHTILKAVTTESDLKKVCDDAIEYGFCSIAVNTGMVKACAEFLKGTDVLVDAAISFPLGITSIECKAFEIEDAIKNGAGEIDYVVNVGKVKEGDFDYIEKEMETLVGICKKNKKTVKVIFENCYLTDSEKLKLCEIAKKVKPDFIKTSTGFGTGGATYEDVKLMKEAVGNEVKVKAAGGVRTLDDFLKILSAGAQRVGCSCSKAIADDYSEYIKK